MRLLPVASVALLIVVPMSVRAQTDSAATAERATTRAAPPVATVAPRNPGGTSAGAVQGDQGRMDATVGGIDRRLLSQERDRPALPNQAPSRSQTLPGGTASGQAPH